APAAPTSTTSAATVLRPAADAGRELGLGHGELGPRVREATVEVGEVDPVAPVQAIVGPVRVGRLGLEVGLVDDDAIGQRVRGGREGCGYGKECEGGAGLHG